MKSHRSMAVFCGLLLACSFSFADYSQVYATDNTELASEDAAQGSIPIDEQHFPDPAFRAWLLDKNNLRGIGADGKLSDEERQSVTGLFLQRKGLKSVKGIEYFPALRMLDIEGNYVEEIDLSSNTELLNVYLRTNKLTKVDFSHNTKLEFIEIFDNRLTDIDLSMLPNLKFVHLDYNKLKVIDISHNLKLEDDGFVGNNNPLEKVILPKIPGRSFDSFVISELNDLPGYEQVIPKWYSSPNFEEASLVPIATSQDKVAIPFDGQTLYVQRVPNSYSIIFDPQGGAGLMPDQKRSYNDGNIKLPAHAFSKRGGGV